MRRLSIRLSTTLEKMGYRTSHNTLQPVLGGWKKRTRGFVYQAMLKLSGRSSARIPEEDFVTPSWQGDRPYRPRPEEISEAAAQRLARLLMARGHREKPSLERFLKEAGRHLRRSQRSDRLLDFLATRTERVYGISRDKAGELLISAMSGRIAHEEEKLEAVDTFDPAEDES